MAQDLAIRRNFSGTGWPTTPTWHRFYSCASMVCLRFLADFLQIHTPESDQPIFSGNNPGLERWAKAAGKVSRKGARGLSDSSTPRSTKKRRNSGQRGISAPSPIDSSVMPPFVSLRVMTLTHPGQPSSQAAMAGLGFCFIASTCSFRAFFISLTEGSALWVAIIQL